MEDLIRQYQALMNGLVDLSRMMADEDPGATFVHRLAEESEQFHVRLLTALSDELNLDTAA